MFSYEFWVGVSKVFCAFWVVVAVGMCVIEIICINDRLVCFGEMCNV